MSVPPVVSADSGGLPITQIEYPEDLRFEEPVPPTFSAGESVLSILSLIFMSALSTVMLLQVCEPESNVIAGLQASAGTGFLGDLVGVLRPPTASVALPAWVWLPFAFTIFGATVGWLFEIYLLATGTPFYQTRSRATSFVLQVRLLNLAPVTATIFFFVCCLVVKDASTRMGLLYLSGMGGVMLSMALFFGGAEKAMGALLPGLQVVQIILGLVFWATGGLPMVAELLIVQAVLQLFSLMTTTATPLRSTVFHVSSTFSGLALYNALLVAVTAQPDLPFTVAPAMPPGSLVWWGFLVFSLGGLVVASRLWPRTYNNYRTILSNAIWAPLYFLLVSAKRFPKPKNLSALYKSGRPDETQLAPYWVDHPEFLAPGLNIPSARKLEDNVSVFADVVAAAKKTFALIAFLDHTFPQADSNIPLAQKPRLPMWSSGQEYWPAIFTMKLFGNTIPGRVLEPAPEPAIAAFKEGQLLAYLTESSVGSTFVRAAPERGEGALVTDFRFLERYATKPDYASYGGMAYFRVSSERKRLELVSVVPPQGTVEIAANPHDPSFRQAESQILASLYFQAISGKHLAEIHMTYNLVEVAMHNAFDAQGQWNHPFRTFMYLHFFTHELAEELTTEHLVQDGAVFTQVFATLHGGLIEHLNDCYSTFQYGEDEDFEERARLMTMPPQAGETKGTLLPNSAIKWELRYTAIFQRYTTSLIEAIYAEDDQVKEDEYVQALHRELNLVLRNGLPPRYDAFQTRKGLARFASDTIQHVVVRHQVYGTTAVRAAMDPRISKTQVPADGGTSGVDEWRSLVAVALATARARFTLLMGDFNYLLKGVDPEVVPEMQEAFERLQDDLLALDEKWKAGEKNKRFNYDYFRALPSDLHTGPGY